MSNIKNQAHLDFLAKESSIPLWFFYLIQGIFPANSNASTFPAALIEFTNSQRDSGERVVSAYRAIELATTLAEAKEAVSLVGSTNEKIRWYAFRHWNQLACRVVENISDPQALVCVLPNLPKQSVALEFAVLQLLEHPLREAEFLLVHNLVVSGPGNQQALLQKWLSETTNLVSLKKIYHYSLHGSDIQGEAWEKWNAIGRQLIATASTIKEVRTILQHLPSGGTAMEYAAARVIELSR